MTTYRDYLWVDGDEYAGWMSSGYLVTLIGSATPGQVLDRLGAFEQRRTGTGFDGFHRRVMEIHSFGLIEPMTFCAQIVAVADIGDGWVLMLQGDSEYLGGDGTFMAEVIAEHEVVSHSRNVNASSRFSWWRGGDCQASFDTLVPTWDLDRLAESPTSGSPTLLRLVEQVGGILVDEAEPRTEFFHVPGAFALAEMLTGVAMTPELLSTAEFTVAIVPTVPDAQCSVEHELPVRSPLLGETATWGEVERLYRSSRPSTVHGDLVQTETSTEQGTAVEVWSSPFGRSRQEDGDGLVLVSDGRDTWFRGPYPPSIDVPSMVEVHRRWDGTFARLLPESTRARPETVAGRSAWVFDLPPDHFGSPVEAAFDGETGVVLRVRNSWRTEEFTRIVVDHEMPEDTFRVPS